MSVINKPEVRKVVDKIIDVCKSAGVKRLYIGAADSSAGLIEQNMLEVTNKHNKCRKLKLKFLKKATLRPVRVSHVMEQL